MCCKMVKRTARFNTTIVTNNKETVYLLCYCFNRLMGTLKPQSNASLYSNTVFGTLAVDGWAVTFGTAMRGLGGLGPRPVPSSLYQT